MAKHLYVECARCGKTISERTRMYRAVHAACRKNGLDDDDRKAMQVELCGKASLSDMTVAEIARLLDRLNRNSKAPPDTAPMSARSARYGGACSGWAKWKARMIAPSASL
jgi:phage gp16-like protein